MLVELGAVEQRYRAALDVLEEGASVTSGGPPEWRGAADGARVAGRYAQGGLGGLADRSSRPASCPHQMPAVIEARVVSMRRDHPGWRPSRIRWELERAGVAPLPGRSAVYRALVRHGLIVPGKRKRRRGDYRRWERGRAMDLWQMDVMGRVHLAGGVEVKIVTGIDDHSRFVVCAKAVMRATARPVCQALGEALRLTGSRSRSSRARQRARPAYRLGDGSGFPALSASATTASATATACGPVAAGTLTTQMISSGGVRADDARVPAHRCLAGCGRERGRVGVAACFLGDPDGDVVTSGWFVHVWHCKRGVRHFRVA